MMQFQQSDTVGTFSGPSQSGRPTNTGGTVSRLCSGSVGVTPVTVTMDANAKDLYAVAFDVPVPNFTLWNAGTYVIRLNVQTANASVTWSRIYLARLNSSGTFQAKIGELAFLPYVLGTPGVKEIRVPGEAQYLRSYGDRILAVLCLTNQGTLPPYNLTPNSNVAQAFSFVPSELIDTPLVN
jgi:hypothetical protein